MGRPRFELFCHCKAPTREVARRDARREQGRVAVAVARPERRAGALRELGDPLLDAERERAVAVQRVEVRELGGEMAHTF